MKESAAPSRNSICAGAVAEVSGRFCFGAVFGDRIGVWRPPER
jgi:hypothetical protein